MAQGKPARKLEMRGEGGELALGGLCLSGEGRGAEGKNGLVIESRGQISRGRGSGD